MMKPGDKRRHPRVSHRLRVQSDFRDPRLELETIDLSAGGLRCTAPVFLPPMTKMALSLVLPRTPEGPDEDQVVSGEAIVVRSEPATARGSGELYNVALFFSRMEEADRRRLQDFLRNRSRSNGRS